MPKDPPLSVAARLKASIEGFRSGDSGRVFSEEEALGFLKAESPTVPPLRPSDYFYGHLWFFLNLCDLTLQIYFLKFQRVAFRLKHALLSLQIRNLRSKESDLFYVRKKMLFARGQLVDQLVDAVSKECELIGPFTSKENSDNCIVKGGKGFHGRTGSQGAEKEGK